MTRVDRKDLATAIVKHAARADSLVRLSRSDAVKRMCLPVMSVPVRVAHGPYIFEVPLGLVVNAREAGPA